MGAGLVVATVGVLVVDQSFAPWFPFLTILVVAAAFACTHELLDLMPPAVRPQQWLCMAGIAALLAANWLPHQPWWPLGPNVWLLIACVFAAWVMLIFVAEMAAFQEPGHSVMRMALAVWLLAYLGVLPSFLAQLRWLPGVADGTMAVALTIFVPKCCDIGAYFTGKIIGRHPMTPVLSPKKTWEGACGGLGAAVLSAVLLDQFGPAAVLHGDLAVEIGFGLSVGAAGMLGDLAESLIKRDCQHKDASNAVPGFGGFLDVVDAILFAAPVSYVWLTQTLAT